MSKKWIKLVENKNTVEMRVDCIGMLSTDCTTDENQAIEIYSIAGMLLYRSPKLPIEWAIELLRKIKELINTPDWYGVKTINLFPEKR